MPNEPTMELTRIYQCFSDLTRLRILHLLSRGPLCVSHLQDILEIPQSKVSKHLAYLKLNRLVEGARHESWIIYHLPQKQPPSLLNNLRCLQDCVKAEPQFKQDLKKLKTVQSATGWMKEILQSATTKKKSVKTKASSPK
jgi:DNA-binding transcriptional ArsR family regulator